MLNKLKEIAFNYLTLSRNLYQFKLGLPSVIRQCRETVAQARGLFNYLFPKGIRAQADKGQSDAAQFWS